MMMMMTTIMMMMMMMMAIMMMTTTMIMVTKMEEHPRFNKHHLPSPSLRLPLGLGSCLLRVGLELAVDANEESRRRSSVHGGQPRRRLTSRAAPLLSDGW